MPAKKLSEEIASLNESLRKGFQTVTDEELHEQRRNSVNGHVERQELCKSFQVSGISDGFQ